GVRLERPLVFGLDYARGGAERRLDVAGRPRPFLALAHGRAADVVKERVLLDERRLDVRPFDFQLLRRLDGVPFLVGDDAEKALLPDHFRARDIANRGFIDLHWHGARDRRTDHASVQHPGAFHVGAEVRLRIDDRRDVLARDRLADDLVFFRVLWLGLAG